MVLHLEVSNIHVGPLDVLLTNLPDLLILLYFIFTIDLDLLQLSSHILNLVLQFLSSLPFQLKLFR